MQSQPRSVEQLIDKHRSNGLLIDTNLLLLLAIGSMKRGLIEKFKRTDKYLREDFQKVAEIRRQFTKHFITPNILTETDNLGRQLPESDWPAFAEVMLSLTRSLTEQYVPSHSVTTSGLYAKYGLSDVASLTIGQPFLLLTDDLKMYGAALGSGIDAINLNHLRYSWQ